MKRAATAALAIFCLLLLTVTADAYDEQELVRQQYAASGAQALEESLQGDAEEILEDFSPLEGDGVETAASRLWQAVRDRIGGVFRASVKNGCVILICGVLCSLAAAVLPGQYASGCLTAGVLAVSAVSVYDANAFLSLGRKTLEQLHTFSTLLLPTMAVSATAAGALGGGAAKYGAAVLFMNLLMELAQRLILPLIYAYTAAGIAGAAMGTDGLKGAADLLKWLAVTAMKALVITFVTYLTVTGVIAGGADAAKVKIAKTAVSTVLPVVGSMIADASDTVLAGAAMVKNAVGLLGLAAVAGICLVPFLRLGVNYLIYKACAGLTGAVGNSRICRAVETVSTAFGMLLGLVGVGAVMLFLSVISFMKAVI